MSERKVDPEKVIQNLLETNAELTYQLAAMKSLLAEGEEEVKDDGE